MTNAARREPVLADQLAAPTGLEHAFDVIDDFVTVQSPLCLQNLGPVMCLWEAAGVSDDQRAILGQRIRDLASAEQAGGLALGVLIGLLATQPSSR